MKNEKTTNFLIIGGKWFDKVNGNTYHNAKIIDGTTGKVYFSGFGYGYGSAYLDSARQYIINILNINNYNIIDGGSFHVKKRDCQNGNF